MAKRTYMTLAETIEFCQWTHSDSRRFKLQQECKEKIEKGMINPMPWTQAERIITKDVLEEWKNLKTKRDEEARIENA